MKQVSLKYSGMVQQNNLDINFTGLSSEHGTSEVLPWNCQTQKFYFPTQSNIISSIGNITVQSNLARKINWSSGNKFYHEKCFNLTAPQHLQPTPQIVLQPSALTPNLFSIS